jgi:hypothetical protein
MFIIPVKEEIRRHFSGPLEGVPPGHFIVAEMYGKKGDDIHYNYLPEGCSRWSVTLDPSGPIPTACSVTAASAGHWPRHPDELLLGRPGTPVRLAEVAS